jgi:hypothetical protein
MQTIYTRCDRGESVYDAAHRAGLDPTIPCRTVLLGLSLDNPRGRGALAIITLRAHEHVALMPM